MAGLALSATSRSSSATADAHLCPAWSASSKSWVKDISSVAKYTPANSSEYDLPCYASIVFVKFLGLLDR